MCRTLRPTHPFLCQVLGCRSRRKSGKCNGVWHNPLLAGAGTRRGVTAIQDASGLGCLFFKKKKKNVYLAALGLSCGMRDLVP